MSAAPAEAREKQGRLRTLCGTPAYQAPELRSQSAAGYEGPPVDMWALGAVLYEMLHGRPAFAGETMEVLQHRISKASHAQLAASLSPGPKGLVRSLLQPDPAMRLTAHAVADNSWVGPDRPPGSPPGSPPHAKPAARPHPKPAARPAAKPAAKPASVAPASKSASSMPASASLPSIGSPSIKVALVASPSLPAHTRAAEPTLVPTHSRSRAKSPHAATAVRAATVAAAAAARAAAARHAAARHAAAARRAAAARHAAAEPMPSAHAVGALPHSHSGGISPRKGKGSPRKGSPRKGSPRKGSPRKGSPRPSRRARRAAAAAGRKLQPRDALPDSHRLALAQHQAQHQLRPGALNAAYARARGEAVTLAAADALAARRLSQLLPALGGQVGAGAESGAYGCHEAHPLMRRAAARSDGRLWTEPLPACGYGEQSRVLMASAAPPPAYGYGEPVCASMAHSQSAPSMATVTVHEHGTEQACAQSDHAHDRSGSLVKAPANE